MNEEIILRHFFYMPMSRFGVRELSRKTGLDTKTIMKYLKLFVRKKIIVRKKEKGSFPYYEANRLSSYFKFAKGHLLIRKVFESGLVGFLEQKLKPKAIVLFGSVAKGTYHKKSDIDIFIYGKYKQINASNYGRRMGHKINILFEDDPAKLSRGLRDNIYNGEILSGKLEA